MCNILIGHKEPLKILKNDDMWHVSHVSMSPQEMLTDCVTSMTSEL
jgi:hypothetical protein